MGGRAEEDGREVEQPDVFEGEEDRADEPEDGDISSGTEESDEDELLKNEDAIQTAARILAKHKHQKAETQTETEASTDAGTEAVSSESAVEDDDIDPPVRLTAEAKQAFKKWPKRAKQEFSTAVKQMEGRFTKAQQDAVAAKQQAEHILQAVRPYYTSKPELAAKGITEAQVITGLIGNHQLLTSDNPAVRRQNFLRIGQSIGLVDQNGNLVEADEQTQSAVNNTQMQQIINNALQERLKPVESYIEAQNKARQNQQIEAVRQEIQAVVNEKDSLGNYAYPELHDNDYHMQRVKPLVAGFVRSIPGLGYGEATRMAVNYLRQKDGKSGIPNPTGLPTNNSSHKQRAAEAGVSVRGKTTSASNMEKLTPLQEKVMAAFPIGGR